MEEGKGIKASIKEKGCKLKRDKVKIVRWKKPIGEKLKKIKFKGKHTRALQKKNNEKSGVR